MPPLQDIGRLPDPADNCAIAIRDLEAGALIRRGDAQFALSHKMLEGHRFAVRDIPKGERLTSWGQRFGVALRDISAGDYVINRGVQIELEGRQLDFELPSQPNFDNQIMPYQFDAASFRAAAPLPRHSQDRRFMGYARAGGRGVGTRNMIVVLGTSSLVAGFVRTLTQMTAGMADGYENVDGIVPVAHTEGGHRSPNNRELLLRTLAGFMVHPNVGAAVAIDYGSEAITNEDLRGYMQAKGYPLDAVAHQFYSLSNVFEENVAWFRNLLDEWLPRVNRSRRTAQSLGKLKIALQCGGSDAFSGISGNPLAAWVAKEVIRYGGSANLAETDELIGAESYVLDKVERLETAHRFLAMVERYKEWVGWHGQTAEGNPSGGNKYRGLYNIYLKSLGAAAKRHPDVPLHDVIDYSQPMTSPGFYFMDSPGNDLESVAGQVASGCNMIFFVTGNGSITNFPFAPTIKIVTTSARYELLKYDMDVNAGDYLDGTPLAAVGAKTLDLTVDVAGGRLSLGEEAGHHQAQIWRDWQQTRQPNVTMLEPAPADGQPLPIAGGLNAPKLNLPVYEVNGQLTSEQIGLVMPTSLCSGQIARMIADSLNAQGMGRAAGLSRFAALVHTEGCGGTVVPEFKETFISYLQHPKLRHVLLLEHGCEITHNSYFRQLMTERGLDPKRFGWASIQLDGGIDAVMQKVARWFARRLEGEPMPRRKTAGLEALRMALLTEGEVSDNAARELAKLGRIIVGGGGTVIVSDGDRLWDRGFARRLGLAAKPKATLAYGQRPKRAGFHVMTAPRPHWSETLTGLGAAGLEVMLALVDKHPLAGHPLVPVLQVAAGGAAADLDAVLADDSALHRALLELTAATLRGEHIPRHQQTGADDFQMTRGLMGVSF